MLYPKFEFIVNSSPAIWLVISIFAFWISFIKLNRLVNIIHKKSIRFLIALLISTILGGLITVLIVFGFKFHSANRFKNSREHYVESLFNVKLTYSFDDVFFYLGDPDSITTNTYGGVTLNYSNFANRQVVFCNKSKNNHRTTNQISYLSSDYNCDFDYRFGGIQKYDTLEKAMEIFGSTNLVLFNKSMHFRIYSSGNIRMVFEKNKLDSIFIVNTNVNLADLQN
jgi:hypothetical protein